MSSPARPSPASRCRARADRTNSRRWGNSAFWGLLATSFWFGDFLGDIGNGVLVLALVAIAGAHLLGKVRPAVDHELGTQNPFGPARQQAVPAGAEHPFTAFVGTLAFNYTPLKDTGLIDPKVRYADPARRPAAIVALATCYAWLRPPTFAPIDEGGRLADSIGWALVLPQMLAALGVIFAAAGVGTTIAPWRSAIIPHGNIFLAVVLFACVGMVAFTMIMGNAFAAFPVMAAAIGVPILIQADGGNPR
jgi:uncharacterized membrane protein